MKKMTPRGRRVALTALAAASALAAVPAASQAGTVSVVSGKVVYQAAAGEVNHVQPSVEGGFLTLREFSAPLSAGLGCQLVDARTARCSGSGFDLRLGDKNDGYYGTGQGFQSIRVDAGPDSDTLHVNGERQVEDLIGGTGRDSAFVGATQRVVVSVDNVANDGIAGSTDNVRSDIEVLAGGAGNDELRGNEGVNVFEASAGNDTYFGFGGNDDYIATNDSGNDTFHGGSGSQDAVSYKNRSAGVAIRLDGITNDGTFGTESDNIQTDVESAAGGNGADTLVGSPNADRLFGAGGADSITGGGGADTIYAGAGNDSVFARDGVRDSISCSTESDRVTADRGLDAISSSCETIL